MSEPVLRMLDEPSLGLAPAESLENNAQVQEIYLGIKASAAI
jgi:hypothetical protein